MLMFNPHIYHHTISKINRSSKANSGINLPLWQSTIRHGFFIGPFRGVIRTVYEAFNRNSTLALASCASFWEENRSLRLSPSAGYSAMTFSPSILVSLQLYSKSTWKRDSLRLNKLCFPTANPTKVDVYFSPLDFIYLSSNTSRFDDWSHVCRRACPQPGVDNATFACYYLNSLRLYRESSRTQSAILRLICLTGAASLYFIGSWDDPEIQRIEAFLRCAHCRTNLWKRRRLYSSAGGRTEWVFPYGIEDADGF